MKRKFLSFLLSLLLCVQLLPTAQAAGYDLALNAANFPDANFRAYLAAHADLSSNGWLSQAERDKVISMDLTESGIGDLTGLCHFRNLEELYCGGNQLTQLDLSGNPKLIGLVCPNNQLTTLDVSQNPGLQGIDCGQNQLAALDLSANPALQGLDCAENNLQKLDVSKNPALLGLDCGQNQLSALDVTHNPALLGLRCNGNDLQRLDVTKNAQLQGLDCEENDIEALDLSQCPALTQLYCRKNQLTRLDVTDQTGLTNLDCDGNQIDSIDLSHNPELTELLIQSNRLRELDLRSNEKLQVLLCNANQLACLDLRYNTQLTYVSAGYNEVTVDAPSFEVDLRTLPGFDIQKASNWQGCTVDGYILKQDFFTYSVTYDYDLGNGTTETFSLRCVSSHNYQYTVSGNQIIESCDDGCGHRQTASFTLGNLNNATEPVTFQIQFPDGWAGSTQPELQYLCLYGGLHNSQEPPAFAGEFRLFLYFGCGSAYIDFEKKDYLPGDTNLDGAVTDQDAVYLLFHVMMPGLYPLSVPADFDHDGVVTDQDAVYLLFHVMMPNFYPLS